MRISLSIGVVMLAMLVIPFHAQVVEGKVAYKIEASSENADSKVAVGMMQGSTMDIYFTPKHSRTEFVMGTMMRMVSIIDEEKGEVLSLISGMTGKTAIRSSIAEVEDEILEPSKPTVRLVDEKKEIAGMTCKKAILMDSTGNETEIWYTSEIKMSAKGQSFFNDHFPGYPLQFTIKKNGANITMTAYEVKSGFSKEEKKELFEMVIPEGYQEASK